MDKTEEIELMNNHLEQLIKLKQSGYRCDQEISKVLGKMHEYMGVNRNQQKFSIESGYGSIAAHGTITSSSDSLQYVSYNDVDKELQRRFHNTTSKLVIVGDSDRGKGKTTLLLRLSQENGIPVIVGANTEMYGSALAKKKGINCTVFSVNDLRGSSFPNGVYIDCSVSKEQLHQIKRQGIEIKGGFHHDDVLSSLVQTPF
ncbi:hypothetical protein [Bacillus licheniformis]|uniref:hypothetical protein n=3 Tax=Bacillus TaxID=1386 RepID=UPI0011A0A493|nr:hypothetical protein [Bacillus licheniformis]MDQ9095429.1 hypothetical protein [Bacillus licheniformis]MEC0476997.1 hypothetical protein [Bacillus licheniformis]MEC0491038.1 hypothetical protein [Bacillus licheniformis]